MEEKAFKKILLKSKVRTSEEFTDDLMKRLEARKAERPTSIQITLRPAIWGFVVGGMAILYILFLVPMSSFTVFNRIHLGKTPLMVGLIFLFIMGINHMLRLSQKVESYNQLLK